MSLKDLDLILNKEAIISTYPASSLASEPEEVERVYRTHARTHISLGDTSKYVDLIMKWVSGLNKGTFIGGVVGDYGHGKTSFLVHVWDKSTQSKVLAIPPFSWLRVSDMMDATAAWLMYVLGTTHPSLTKKVEGVYDRFKETTLSELAKSVAEAEGKSFDEVLDTLKAAERKGAIDTKMQPRRFLDFCAEVASAIKDEGYQGMLVLLDEPEQAAKRLSTAAVAHILFELADELKRRKGDYGVFVSVPENFLAQVTSTIASLPARLGSRNCFPRLGDIYGSAFAHDLWTRYVEEFDLGEEGRAIASAPLLEAVGQVGSSERSDLSYGPRTVVSAFRRMVYCYREGNGEYSVHRFVKDCLEEEIYVSPDYRSRVRKAIDSPEARDIGESVLLALAGFPNGLRPEVAKMLDIEDIVSKLPRRTSLVYKRGGVFGLSDLRRVQEGRTPDELADTLRHVFEEFDVSPESSACARHSFITHIIPKIFEERKGQQLRGWDLPDPDQWMQMPDGTRIAELVGAFGQTQSDFPARCIAVAVGSLEADPDKVYCSVSPGEGLHDIFFHFRLRWNPETPLPEKRIEIRPGDPKRRQPGLVRLSLDLAGDPAEHDYLKEALDGDLLTPFGVLYLMDEMARRTLTRDLDAQWQAIREQLVRGLLLELLGDLSLREQAATQMGQDIPSGGPELVGSVARRVLLDRYPNYSTLIRQPRWQQTVGAYVLALQNQEIPLRCKRGREPWDAPGERVEAVFNTSLMNLKGGMFSGYDDLVSITSEGRGENVRVEFRIHPLEESIMNQVTSQKPDDRMIIEGKECWWLPLAALKQTVLRSGYLVDELKEIVEIGRSRGTFESTEHKGEVILYSRPLDLEQMKSLLRDTLEGLRSEVEEFQKLPRYSMPLDLDAVAGDIEGLRDEAHNDSLLAAMENELERNRGLLPGYVGELGQELEGVRATATEIKRQFLDSREAGCLDSKPKYTSKWCADLVQYVLSNLKQEKKAISSACDSVALEADRAKASHIPDKTPDVATAEAVDMLLQGRASLLALQGKLEGVKRKAQQTLSYLRDYEHWLQLLNTSDAIHDEILRLKAEPSHARMGSDLLLRLERTWKEISEHLATRNIQGLGSHQQFRKQLDEVDKQRNDYMRGLRTEFEEQKGIMNGLLSKIGLSDCRCSITFNPDDIQGSYAGLYSEAAEHVVNGLCGELNELHAQRLELLYARDILQRLEPADIAGLLETMESSCLVIKEGISCVDAAWIQTAVDSTEEGSIKLRDDLKTAQDLILLSRRPLRKPKGVDSTLSSMAQDMLRQLPERESANLKELILGMMERGRDSAEVLDVSLSSLVELFREGRIQISVERTKR